jgi:hypothetical protein
MVLVVSWFDFVRFVWQCFSKETKHFMTNTIRTTSVSPVPMASKGHFLQRACACGNHTNGEGECESCKKNREQLQSAGGERLQRSAVDAGAQDSVPDSVYATLRSPGHPLDEATREYMESRFDHDFSGVPSRGSRLSINPPDDQYEREAEHAAYHIHQVRPSLAHRDFSAVRLHTDAQAAASARAIGAEAYTVGNRIVFADGKYQPKNANGRSLLAHELTHVVQQGQAASVVQRHVPVDILSTSITQEGAEQLTNAELEREIQRLRMHIKSLPIISVEYEAATSNLLTLERVLHQRQGTASQDAPPISEPVQPQRQHSEQRVSSPTPDVESQFSEEEIIEAGLLATGHVLQYGVAPEAQTLREMYNQGAARIEAEIARMQAAKMAEEVIARQASAMRHELALNVRRTGSALMRQGAELFDKVRGNTSRPTYETLRRAGKSNAAIIKSAAKTNRFINRLPTGLRWAGRGMWFVSAGISIYLVLDAPPTDRGRVAQEEVEGIIGGIGGATVFQGICAVVGIATEGLGFIVCGLVGGAIGYNLARGNLFQLMDIAPTHRPAMAGTIYRIEGDFDVTDLLVVSITHRRVSAAENVLVVATGMVSGSQMSGRGHHRSYEVTPANAAAVRLFGGHHSRYVPQYLLHTATGYDLKRSAD